MSRGYDLNARIIKLLEAKGLTGVRIEGRTVICGDRSCPLPNVVGLKSIDLIANVLMGKQ